MIIKIGVVGKIASGHDSGFFVKVIDDSENTGGYLVLTSSQPDMSDGFDCWVESDEMLAKFFDEMAWIVRWQESPR